MASTPVVHILTHAHHPLVAYSVLMVFKTLRVGFPNARVEVFDNGSHPDMIQRIREAAESVGASFKPMPLRHYSDHWRWSLFDRQWDQGDAPVVFVDPDVVFWENCEGWEFGNALMAGRLMPERKTGRFIEHARLHPSHLWIPSIPRFRSEFSRLLPTEREGRWNAVGPVGELAGPTSHFFNTLAPLYSALRSRCAPFTSSHLDCYDHLFFGSHLASVGSAEKDGSDVLSYAHRAAASGELEKLRGIWRLQDDVGMQTAPRAEAATRRMATARQLAEWQSLHFDDQELEPAMTLQSLRFALAPQGVRYGPRPCKQRR